MNLKFRKIALLAAGILVTGKLLAQNADSTQIKGDYVQPFSGNGAFRTWSIGIHGGILTTSSVLGSNTKLDFTSPLIEAGFGGYVKKQITPAIGFQADLLLGNLSADHSQLTSPGTELFRHFSTKINYAGSVSANISFGNISWHKNKSAIQPYFTIGGGYMSYTPVITLPDGAAINFKNNGGGIVKAAFAPVGVGLKFDVASWINLDIGYQVNFVFADNIDGYNYGQNNDRFSYSHIGLEFVLGNTSKPKLATHNPVSSMRAEYLAENQSLKKQLHAQNEAQKAVNTAQQAKLDQLQANLDATNASLSKLTVDSDNDGVPDFYDKCPNTPSGTKVDGAGCPLPVQKPDVKVYVTEQDNKVVKEAIKNLEFDSGRAIIRRKSFASLNNVARLLITKNFSLKLAGHTDNIGSPTSNMKLSKDRAGAIKIYFVSRGVNPSRIEATGYGQDQPIATNTTPAGRQMNRRVEFTLY